MELTLLLILQEHLDAHAGRGDHLAFVFVIACGLPGLGPGGQQGGVNNAGVGVGHKNGFVCLGVLAAQEAFEAKVALAQTNRRADDYPPLLPPGLEPDVLVELRLLGLDRLDRLLNRILARLFRLGLLCLSLGRQSGPAARFALTPGGDESAENKESDTLSSVNSLVHNLDDNSRCLR